MNLRKLSDKKILILGFGKEGVSTLTLLRKIYPNKIISIADQKKLSEYEANIRKVLEQDKKLEFFLGKDYQKYLDKFDVIFKSPGIIGRNLDKNKITSQTEIFIEKFRERIIGITGTKGKSTTSSLIYKILKDANINVELIGNIGTPSFSYLSKKDTFFVYELSSFQLENLKKSPHIAVILNIFPEHLDYHGSFNKYQEAKVNIFKWQTNEDFLIYSLNTIPRQLTQKAKPKRIPFSLNEKLENGAFIEGENIIYNQEKVLRVADVNLKGEFNLNNVMAAVCVAKLFKIQNSSISNSIKTFKPLSHRLEYLGNFQGIDFYNDSIATIPQATIAALGALKPNVSTLIVGGYDRGLDYSELAKTIIDEKINNVILFPTTGKIILEEMKKQKGPQPNYFFIEDMGDAVEIAKKVTAKNKICLLSPASPSFNLFKNFEERGDLFRKEVQNL